MSNKETHNIKLVSGVPTVIYELSGKQQRLYTDQSISSGDRSYKLLASIVKSVGSVEISTMTEEDQQKFFKGMLSCDKKKILTSARDITYDFDPLFIFTYKYKDKKGNPQELMKEIDLTGGFPQTSVKIFDEALVAGKRLSELKKYKDEIREQAKDMDFTEYEDVIKHKTIEFTYPKSGLKGKFTMADGGSEAVISTVKAGQFNSHVPLLMRSPCYMPASGTTYINLQANDLDKQHPMDLEYLRMLIAIFEGKVDSEIQFECPEDMKVDFGQTDVVVDVTGEMAFFFPSEAT